MKYIKTREELNEAKYGTVKLSDLGDNLSTEYNLAEELKEIKKDYKKLGKHKLIDKIIKFVNKIGEDTYSKISKQVKTKYHVNLPKYKSATDKNYWNGKFGRISLIVIALGSLISGVEKEKEFINKEIKSMEDKLEKLNELEKTNEKDD